MLREPEVRVAVQPPGAEPRAALCCVVVVACKQARERAGLAYAPVRVREGQSLWV